MFGQITLFKLSAAWLVVCHCTVTVRTKTSVFGFPWFFQPNIDLFPGYSRSESLWKILDSIKCVFASNSRPSWPWPKVAFNMTVSNHLIILFAIVGYFHVSQCVELTFELPDSAKECFFEEIPEGTESTIEFQVNFYHL